MLTYKVVARKNPLTKAIKYYGQVTGTTPVSINQLAEEMAAESTLTRHDILACLSSLQSHVIAHLQNGQSIRLGDLGSFHATLKSKGADTADKFSSTDIEKVMVRFTKSALMRNVMKTTNSNISFSKKATSAVTVGA